MTVLNSSHPHLRGICSQPISQESSANPAGHRILDFNSLPVSRSNADETTHTNPKKTLKVVDTFSRITRYIERFDSISLNSNHHYAVQALERRPALISALLFHRIYCDKGSFFLELPNTETVNNLILLESPFRILIHSDSAYLRLYDPRNESLLFLGDDIDPQFEVVYNEHQNLIATKLKDSRLRVWVPHSNDIDFLALTPPKIFENLSNFQLSFDQQSFVFTYIENSISQLGILNFSREQNQFIFNSKELKIDSFERVIFSSDKPEFLILNHSTHNFRLYSFPDFELKKKFYLENLLAISKDLRFFLDRHCILDSVSGAKYPINYPEGFLSLGSPRAEIAKSNSIASIVNGNICLIIDLKNGEILEQVIMDHSPSKFFITPDACMFVEEDFNGSLRFWNLL